MPSSWERSQPPSTPRRNDFSADHLTTTAWRSSYDHTQFPDTPVPRTWRLRMRRRLPVLLLTALLAVAATGCLGGGTSGGADSLSSTQSHKPVTLTFWSAYT